MELYEDVLERVRETAAAADAFYTSADGYDAAVNDGDDVDVVARNREHVVQDWIGLERQRLSLDRTVRDVQPAFAIRTRDETGAYTTDTVTAESVQEFYFYSLGGVTNLDSVDPRPQYSEEEAGEVLSALQTAYSELQHIQHRYLDALELLLDHPDVVNEKIARFTLDNTAGAAEYQVIEETLQAWNEAEYDPVGT